MPPAGAGDERVTEYGSVWPRGTVKLAGREMLPSVATVTAAVVSARFGRELAWITAEPGATPVTGTVTLVAFAGNGRDAGTDAIAGWSDDRLTVSPDGAGAVRFRVRFAVPPEPTVRVVGEKLKDPTTLTVCVSPVNPVALADTEADPKLTPVT